MSLYYEFYKTFLTNIISQLILIETRHGDNNWMLNFIVEFYIVNNTAINENYIHLENGL